MTDQYIEQLVNDLEDPDKTGFPAIVAMTRLKRALHKHGPGILADYPDVDDGYFARRRADCLQAMGRDAWVKSQDENRGFAERVDLLKAIEGYKLRGDFGWQHFGITEREFYRQKYYLMAHAFYQAHADHQADYNAATFNEKFNDDSIRQQLTRDTVLSDEDIEAIVQMCSQIRDNKYAEMKAACLSEFQKLSAIADDPNVPFDDRVEALKEAKKEMQHFVATANDAEKKSMREVETRRRKLYEDHFQSRYYAAIECEDAYASYKELVALERDIQEEGCEIADVLGIDPTDLYSDIEYFLYESLDGLIEKTGNMVEEGNPSAAHDEFDECFSQYAVGSLKNRGYDVARIEDHRIKLLKAKTKSEFDCAVAHEDAFIKAEQLADFGPSGYKSGKFLDNLFGEDEANKMRGIAKGAFVECAMLALSDYFESNDQNDLFRADFWRADSNSEWSDITDDVSALRERAARNGHRLRI